MKFFEHMARPEEVKKKISEKSGIITQLNTIKEEIDLTRKNLNLVTDECLIDSYIYELTALNKRYQYFLREAKRNGLTAFKMEG